MSRPFSKLKKILEGLFVPSLKMTFCCTSYSGGKDGSTNIPRFYLKINKEFIWDFPRDFEIKKVQFYSWADDNHISELVREYIDTPLEQLLKKEFENEKVDFNTYDLDPNKPDIISVDYKLIALFKAGDRRLGKDALLKWAAKQNNPMVDKILMLRFDNFINEAGKSYKVPTDEKEIIKNK